MLYTIFLWINKKQTYHPIERWAKDINQNYTDEKLQMAIKNMKRCPSSLVIREIQIKLRDHFCLSDHDIGKF